MMSNSKLNEYVQYAPQGVHALDDVPYISKSQGSGRCFLCNKSWIYYDSGL